MKEEILQGYMAVQIFGKVQLIIDDVKGLLEKAQDGELEQPPKVVIYSGFKDAFKALQERLRADNIRYACAPVCCTLDWQSVTCDVMLPLWMHITPTSNKFRT